MIGLGDKFPDFNADSTNGPINFHDWIGDGWVMLFSYSSGYTPVCTTELCRLVELSKDFNNKNIKPIAVTCSNINTEWLEDFKIALKDRGFNFDQDSELELSSDDKNFFFPFPVITDKTREISKQLGILDPVDRDSDGLPLTCHTVFVIDSDKKLRLSILYPSSVGRNFDEILRATESVQLFEKVTTPTESKPSIDVFAIMKPEEAETLFPNELEYQIQLSSS